MSCGSPSDRPDEWEDEFELACSELKESFLGLDGYACSITIDEWELKWRKKSYLAPFIKNHADVAKAALLKNPGPSPVTINVEGHNNNLQIGSNSANSANAVNSGNVASGEINQLPRQAIENSQWQSRCRIITAVTTAALSVWWCLPNAFALGQARFLTTVFLLVFAAVIGALSFFGFRRRNWEKLTLYSLSAVLLLRSGLPSITGYFISKGYADQDSMIADIDANFAFASGSNLEVWTMVCGLLLVVIARAGR